MPILFFKQFHNAVAQCQCLMEWQINQPGNSHCGYKKGSLSVLHVKLISAIWHKYFMKNETNCKPGEFLRMIGAVQLVLDAKGRLNKWI